MDPKISDLIGRLFPELEIKSLDTVDIGWASDIFILNGEYVIKVPRDSSSRKALEKEMKITSVVRSSLPVRIPEYFRRTGNEELEAAAYALIDGVLLTNQDVGKTPFIKASDALAGDSGCVVAGQVSEIMSSIHSIETSLVRDALKPFVQDTWKEKMQGRIRSFREVAASFFKSEEKGKILALLDELACKILGFSYTKRFIHGDFGGWNMLYNPGTERISGLLDWADSRVGDPAIDVTELLYDFGEPFTRLVLNSYGFRQDTGIMKRAVTYLKLAGFQDLCYGIESHSDYFIRRGKEAILELLRQS